MSIQLVILIISLSISISCSTKTVDQKIDESSKHIISLERLHDQLGNDLAIKNSEKVLNALTSYEQDLIDRIELLKKEKSGDKK